MQINSRMRTTSAWISLSILLVGAGGCTTTQKEDVLPQDGPTMRQIYNNHMEGADADDTRKARDGLASRTITEEVVVKSKAPAVAVVDHADDLVNGTNRETVTTQTVTRQRVVKTAKRPASDIHTRAGMVTDDAPPGYGSAEANLKGYTRTASTEINHRFTRLPNPDLVMFVYPHLAGPERTPVPGYATSFPMYERMEYALPGEIHNRGIQP